MKLARIEHWRCGEPISWRGGGGYTYLWIPNEMTAEQLDVLCDQAQKSYLDVESFHKKQVPVNPPGYGATINPATPDTKTVKELREEYEAQAKAYKAYQESVDAARKSFAWHLKEVSNGAVLQFWDSKPEVEVELSWGHNHGVTIDYSPTKIGDYPFPQNDEEDD